VAQRCLSAGTHDTAALAGWSRALLALGAAAPDCVVPVLGHAAALLRPAGLAGFEAFVATGLRSAGRDAAARRRFFSIEDAAARHALDRIAATLCFADAHRWMRPYLAALCGRAVPLAAAPGTRRVRLSETVIRMPDAFPGLSAPAAASLFQAAGAHAAAHLLFGAARFPVGTLKPLQVVLVTLVEDARVEALAMRRYPGLRALWSPWHVARAGGIPTVPALLARLARALFDPAWFDEDGLVRKARRLVAEADPLDSLASRRIGDLLGNDLGQQRLQFDARAHVVEPAYRNDGAGLWRFDDAATPDAETVEMLADTLPGGDAADLPPDPSRPPRVEAVPGRPLRPSRDLGPVVARHPEWDRAAGIERADWVAIRDVAAPAGPPGRVQAMLDAAPLARQRVSRLLRGVAVGGRERLRRQQDGEDLDLAAAVEAAIDLRRGVLPDSRIHQGVAPRQRDLAVCLVLDASESTRAAAGAGGGTVLDGQVHAVALLAEALAGVGTPCTVQAFASCGRDDVRLSRIQDPGASWDAAARAPGRGRARAVHAAGCGAAPRRSRAADPAPAPPADAGAHRRRAVRHRHRCRRSPGGRAARRALAAPRRAGRVRRGAGTGRHHGRQRRVRPGALGHGAAHRTAAATSVGGICAAGAALTRKQAQGGLCLRCPFQWPKRAIGTFGQLRPDPSKAPPSSTEPLGILLSSKWVPKACLWRSLGRSLDLACFLHPAAFALPGRAGVPSSLTGTERAFYAPAHTVRRWRRRCRMPAGQRGPPRHTLTDVRHTDPTSLDADARSHVPTVRHVRRHGFDVRRIGCAAMVPAQRGSGRPRWRCHDGDGSDNTTSEDIPRCFTATSAAARTPSASPW